VKISFDAAMRGEGVRSEGSVSSEGRFGGVPKFHSLGECNFGIKLRLNVQCFLWSRH